MSSLTRSEYRHEEQRRVTESPFKETKWDRHLDTLLTDLNESVGSSRSPAGTQQRAVVPAGGPGVVTEVRGAPGSGDFHERREYVSPDQRTHVVQERFERTSRGDAGKPSATHFYETKPESQYRSSQTASEYLEKQPEIMQHISQFDTKPGTKYHTTETVTEFHQKKPYTVQYYEKKPSNEAKPQSYYRTIRTFSEPHSKQPDSIEYYEDRPPSEPKPKAQYRSTQTVTEQRDKVPTTYQYFDKSPSVERRTNRTVTEYRYPAGTPHRESEPVLRPYTTKSTVEYVDKAPAAPSLPPGQPMTVRYVDKDPITIYHESKSGYTSGPDTPPALPPDPKPTQVVYERIIERQPIIHYYGRRPQEAEPRHSTLPAGQRTYTTVTQHTHSSPAAATLPSDTKPPAYQRTPLARSPEADVANQAVTKQVYKTSYSGDSAPQPIQDGVDPAVQTFDGPAGTSTPYRHTNVSKTTKTSKYTTSGGPAPDPTTLTPGDQLTVMGLTGPRHSPSPNPLEGLDRNLVPELSEPPQPGTTRVTKYEYRSSNRREVSPQPVPAPAPARTLPPPESTRSYVDRREYTSATNTLEHPPPPDTTDKTVTYNVYNTEQQVPQPPVVPGQPGSNTTINYHIYNYGTLGPDGQPVLPPGVLPPGSAPPSAPGTLPRHEVNTNTSTTSSTYRYREQSPPVQKSPAPGTDTTISNSYVFEKHSQGAPPPRSAPSPAPAPGPPGPPGQPGAPGTSYSTSTVTKHYTIGPDGREVPVRPVSPYDQQYPKFPVDEPPQGHHTRTTTTTIERTQTHGSPFPARSPSPSGRRPQRDDGPRVPFPGSPRRPVDDIDTPRRVDELMAQIPDTPQDGTYPHGPRRRDLNGRSSTTTTHFTVHETEPLMDTQTKVTLDAKSGAVVPQAATKPMAGPPIYYPPGSTEFKPKPESEMMFQSYESRGGGKYKSGYKAKGKYKAKGGSKESHAEGGAVIPICLPLCCGAACSVM